jgi:hypothetical protein
MVGNCSVSTNKRGEIDYQFQGKPLALAGGSSVDVFQYSHQIKKTLVN